MGAFRRGCVRRPPARVRRCLGWAAAVAVWGVLVGLLVYRAAWVDHYYGWITRCDGCFYLPVVQHDAPIFGILVLLAFAATWLARRPWQSLLLKLTFLAVAVIYAADIGVMRALTQRLNVEDVAEYGTEFSAILSFLETRFAPVQANLLPLGTTVLAGLLLVALAARFVACTTRSRRPALLGFALLGLGLVAFRFVPFGYAYVHSWAYRNVFEFNADKGLSEPYSEAFARDLARRYAAEPVCARGLSTRPDIILLVVESLSMYQSRLYSGLNDWTPRFDGIARRGVRFVNFFANGFSTEDGLISLLTGRLPVPAVRSYREGGARLSGFGDGASLAAVLKDHGYHTAFLTSGPRNFSGKGRWLRDLGFDFVEGEEAPFYAKWPRFQLNSAPDAALYLRALGYLREFRPAPGRPLFLVLETVSTHQPFFSPHEHKLTEVSAFDYADRTMGVFFDRLAKAGFFDDGILIVLGDHRSMTPMREREYARYGPSALARVPMAIIGRGFRPGAVVTRPYQQVDLLPSLATLVSDRACRSPDSGTFLGPDARPADCVLHAMGTERGHVYARCGEREGVIRIEGDHTRVVSGDLPDPGRLVDKINHDRLARNGP
jgi:lipoteichoic acid synthase